MNKIYLILTFLLAAQISFGQLAYIYDNDKIVYDVELIEWDWSHNQIILEQDGEKRILTPETISQFELVREGVFISTEIKEAGRNQKVFLLKKLSGNYNYYIYKQSGSERYFYKYKGAVTEVPSADGKYIDSDFISEINTNIAGCDVEKIVANRVKLTHRSLTKLFQYTNSPCDDNDFHVSRGIIVAARGTQFSTQHEDNEKYLNRAEFSNSYNLTAGIEFGFHFKRLSFITNLQYYAASYDSEINQENGDLFFEDKIKVRQRGIQNEILARLKSVGFKYQGFFDIGFGQNFHLNKNRSVYNYYLRRGESELSSEERNTLFSNYQIHNVVRVGINAPLDNVSSLTCVLGLQALTSKVFEGKVLNTESLFLAVIYSF